MLMCLRVQVFSSLVEETKQRLDPMWNDVAAGPGTQDKARDAERVSRNVLAEELLMYQRAVSRLAEMCPPLEE